MSISRVKTWIAGEVLSASDLNSEFNNILNNPVDLWSPAGKAADMNGFEFILDGDADTSLTADTDDRVDMRLGGVDLFRFDGTTASSLNGLDFISGATTVPAKITATGETNIGLRLVPKGTGKVQLADGSDATKVVAFDASSLTTATTRTLTVLDADFSIGAATQAQQETGTATTVSVTPGRQHFHASAAKFFIKADSAGTTNTSYNVTSITDVGTGKLRVTIANDFSSADWVCNATIQAQTALSAMVDASAGTPQAAGTVDLLTVNTSNTATDPNYWYVAGFGDL